MALVIADRVRETSTTTGTGTLTLGGAVTGYQTFSSAIGSANTCYYAIVNGSEWEIGVGTVGTGTLARTTVLQSSNADALVSFSAGTKDVFATYPADRAVSTDNAATLTNKTISAGVFTDGYTEETATANTSTAYTIDLANGTVQILTLTGSPAVLTFPTPTAGKGFTLLLKQDATGSRTVTWPSSVKWPSSTAPTVTATASKGDKYTFVADGTYWWGSNAGQNYL